MKDGTPGHVLNVGKFICDACKDADCIDCIDLKRAIYTREKICECPRHRTRGNDLPTSPKAS